MKELMKKIKEFFIRLFTTGPAPIAAPVVQPVEQKVETVVDVQKPVIEMPEQVPSVVQALLEPAVVDTADSRELTKKQQPRKKRVTSQKTKADVKSASKSSSGGRSKPKSTEPTQRRTKSKMQ